MKTGVKRVLERSPSPANERSSAYSSSCSSISLVNQGPSSSSEPDLDTSSTAFEDWHIPPPPKSQKLLMSASEVLFQSNSVAALKEVEPDLAFIITKKEQRPLPPTFTASVTVRGQTFEAENTQAAGAKARAAQLVLYYLMLNNDPALKHLNVSSDNEANPFTQFTEYPLNAFILIKPGVKINIVRAVGNPPAQEFTARVVIDGTKSFEGVGPSKRAAQNEAARNALASLVSYKLDSHIPKSSAAAIENPISGLMCLKPGARIDIIKQEGQCPNIVFTARVVLNGKGYYGTGRRKQDAKKEAAQKALSSLTVQDQPENESDIQEKIDKLERLEENIKRRLTSIQIQTLSKSDLKASKDWFQNWEKVKELETLEAGLEKPKEAPKTITKGGLNDYLKELEASNPIKTPKVVGNQGEKGKPTKTVPVKTDYLKELDARNPIKDPRVVGKQRGKEKTKKTVPGETGVKKLEMLKGLSNTSKPAKNGGFDQNWKKYGTLNSTKETEVNKPARSVGPDPTPEGSPNENPPFTEFGDHIARLVESTFNSLQSADPSIPSYKTLAGVVMTSGPKTNGSRVISVATGSKLISGSNLSLEGKSINDCHAEILARRGLVAFLYDQLEIYSIHPEESIFEPAWNVRLRIKNHILFHLYVSSAPCGSASEQKSSLQTKIEGIDGTVPVTEKITQSSDGFIFGDSLHTMSCTDKMTRWNVVGIQGSLLTHIINPIYFHTMVIGNRFHLDNLRSSLIERVENLRGIPAPFVFVEPVLAGTTQPVATATKGSWIPISPVISVCWVNGWIQPERIESINGKQLEDDSSSSLCKRTFFQRFASLVSKNPGWFPLENGGISYGSLKKAAKKFVQTNELVMASLLDGGLGHWVKKPEGHDDFKIHIEQSHDNFLCYK